MTSLVAPGPGGIPGWQLDSYVDAEADGQATPEQLAILEENRVAWRSSLSRLLNDTEDALSSARHSSGDGREQVVNDLQSELRRLSAAWSRLTGEADELDVVDEGADSGELTDVTQSEPGVIKLQVSWEPGRIVAWAAGPRTPTADRELVEAMLEQSGAPTSGWTRHGTVRLPNGGTADAVGIAVSDVLGWLVAAGAGQGGDEISPGLRWVGRVAIWAVEVAAHGSMLPLLRQRKRGRGNGGDSNGSYSVRWTPSLIDPVRLRDVTDEMPGSVMALDTAVDPQALTRSVLTGMVDAICRDAARRIEVPAPPPVVRTSSDLAESYLARLDGSAFESPIRIGGEVVARLERWGRPVTNNHDRLVVQLDPPDSGDAWYLAVLAPANGSLTSVEEAAALVGSKSREIDDQLTRLERMLPALLRPGSMRRGQVILSQDEAWELMTVTGPQLSAAGFDVRVPALSRRRATPSLRVFADTAGPSAAGANQLADVRWSALFDDVELSAAEIARLAREARPLIRSGGRWVALDRADLKAAAAALAERAETTQMTC
jgi:hypothetical protein